MTKYCFVLLAVKASVFVLLGKGCTNTVERSVNRATQKMERSVNETVEKAANIPQINASLERAAINARDHSKQTMIVPCSRCNGTGSIFKHQNNAFQSYSCPVCGGTGMWRQSK